MLDTAALHKGFGSPGTQDCWKAQRKIDTNLRTLHELTTLVRERVRYFILSPPMYAAGPLADYIRSLRSLTFWSNKCSFPSMHDIVGWSVAFVGWWAPYGGQTYAIREIVTSSHFPRTPVKFAG